MIHDLEVLISYMICHCCPHFLDLGKVSRKKNCCSFGFCPNYLPSLPPIWTTCTTFLKAKNIDLKDIQNDSFPKFFLNKGKILALWVMYTT